ncbi:protein translocase SEC61 complex subunit gamma [Candidatus Woesearchaeota archaeon]|nr:protein translocase SEC61 complex subunit gamma [Candidatus Woesearchaeota archaeon]
MEEQPIEQPSKIKRFLKETIRVLRITKKPGLTEYKGLLKVTGIGISIIGLIGFIIFLLKYAFVK